MTFNAEGPSIANFETQIKQSQAWVAEAQGKISELTSRIEMARSKMAEGTDVAVYIEKYSLDDVHAHNELMNANIAELIMGLDDVTTAFSKDFDEMRSLPDEWMEEPELFLFKDYETKADIISELRKPITLEMLIQEINRYVDSELRYADKSDEVTIDAMDCDFGRQEIAKKRYMEGKD